MAPLNWNQLWKKDISLLIILMVVVPIAGELNFHPFNDTFRVSFGTPLFFFLLLFLRRIPAAAAGILVGICVVLFRVCLDWVMQGSFHMTESFYLRYPVFFYYFIYGSLFSLCRVNKFHQKPIVIGCLGISIEIVASMSELAFYHMLVLGTTITISEVNKLIIIAIFRSFFALGFLNMMNLYETKLKESQVRKENEKMFMHLSNLYVESVHLKKTLQNAELITQEAYQLYRNLQANDDSSSKTALKIAGEVHEIKKDNQRIFAGLSKLLLDKNVAEYVEGHELTEMIVRINEKYAEMLEKDIRFSKHIEGEHAAYHVYTVLSIFNNLVANAVEAIEDRGLIRIKLYKREKNVIFEVIDDGPGITQKYKKLVFKPGFTSKYDQTGTPSTGIGLSYIDEMVTELGGEVRLEDNENGNGCKFIVCLPECSLKREGE
ncbi:sensor histidine kinase [Bacillus paranthracis]|uniref:histidine kinase n=3 Tax=Bacillus cereus group TaxID=86661 RepID=A0AAX3QI33_9BACI|nr:MULTISPECIES: sensor histidine kinase [Bacillus]ACM12242.1 sensor histidine kinase [Bacillus cereus Q1]EEK45503.1 Sensor histidine kinase [Bacillus cereus m1293]EEL01152.1 Sensor histidine kinase [Bacillus cereus BDRD-ST26]MBL3844466.1 sensor histidine kinase [Bacillus cereus]MCD9102035.1 sensor histidine kinase [Bacillus sp. PLB03]BAL17528.1 sensor histidine kinase [Bacillus cereus NC7401]